MALIPKGECFLQIKIGKQTFRDQVVITNNLNHNVELSFLQNRTLNFKLETSFHLALNQAFSSLKKMLSFILIYAQKCIRKCMCLLYYFNG